jgi:hypothetical protein
VGNCYNDDGRLRRRHAHRCLGQTRWDALRYRWRANDSPSGSGRRRQLQQLLPPWFRVCIERIVTPTRTCLDHLHTYQGLRRVSLNNSSPRANVKLPLAPCLRHLHEIIRSFVDRHRCWHAPASYHLSRSSVVTTTTYISLAQDMQRQLDKSLQFGDLTCRAVIL